MLPDNKPEPQISNNVIPAPVELIAPPDEQKSFTDKLNDLFNIELIGANNKLFTKDEQYFIDERAGIYEYEAGLSRAEAEDRAIKELNTNK